MAKVDYAASAAQIVELVGGNENIAKVTHCITRVRFILRDQSIAVANTEAISAVPGVIQVVDAGGQYQVVIGTTVEKMYDEVVAITGNAGGEVAADDGEAPADKEKNPFKILLKAISGIMMPNLGALTGCGIIASLATILTFLVRPGIIDYARMVELMSVNPRALVHLPAVKLAPGFVADLTAFDPELEWDVTPECFHSKSANSGFIGFHLTGKATDTFVAGKPVLVDGRVA